MVERLSRPQDYVCKHHHQSSLPAYPEEVDSPL